MCLKLLSLAAGVGAPAASFLPTFSPSYRKAAKDRKANSSYIFSPSLRFCGFAVKHYGFSKAGNSRIPG